MTCRLYDHFPALCRAALGGNALMAWYSSLLDPQPYLANMADSSDGSALMLAMGLVGAMLIIDVVINDWTPDFLRLGSRRIRLHWRRAFRHRHFFFAGLAFCYAAQPFVAEMHGNGVSLLMFFYWNAFLNLAVALLDAKQRTRIPEWSRACS